MEDADDEVCTLPPGVKAMVNICRVCVRACVHDAQWHTHADSGAVSLFCTWLQTLPPPNTGRPIGTEVLLKFKGYCADLHAWFPYENAKVGCSCLEAGSCARVCVHVFGLLAARWPYRMRELS
eukprot:scaffold2513_cov18-Tisochrysis_lutea.AAC.1